MSNRKIYVCRALVIILTFTLMFTSVNLSTKSVYASVGASGVSSGHHHDGNKVFIDYIASNQKNGGEWSFGGSGREYTVNGAGTYSTSVSYKYPISYTYRLIDDCYRAFLDRGAELSGETDWYNKLKNHELNSKMLYDSDCDYVRANGGMKQESAALAVSIALCEESTGYWGDSRGGNGTDYNFVFHCYRFLLGRADENIRQEEVQNWVNNMSTCGYSTDKITVWNADHSNYRTYSGAQMWVADCIAQSEEALNNQRNRYYGYEFRDGKGYYSNIEGQYTQIYDYVTDKTTETVIITAEKTADGNCGGSAGVYKCSCGATVGSWDNRYDHSWGSSYESSKTEAKCTTDGVIYYKQKCANCGTTKDAGSSVLTKLGHNYGSNYESSRKNETCTTDGTIYYSHKCSRCGNVESNGTSTIPKLGHNFNKTDTSSSRQISAATHNQPSKYYYSCGICGASYSGNYSATRDKVSTGAKEECYHIATNHWSYSVSKDSPGQGCFWYGTRTKHNWSDAVTTAPTVYDTGVRTFTCGSDYIYVTEPKLQFRVFLGNTRINLNSLSNKKVYAVYRGNSLLTEPSGTAIKPAA